MIFELAEDFRDALSVMPDECSKHRMLGLLEAAIRRDLHFIRRHPTTLFQCMWNTCWWYDCPEAEIHYEPLMSDQTRDNETGIRMNATGTHLSPLLESWHDSKLEALARLCLDSKPATTCHPLGIQSETCASRA